MALLPGLYRRVGSIGQWYVFELPKGLVQVDMPGLLPIDVLLLEASKRIGDVQASAAG